MQLRTLILVMSTALSLTASAVAADPADKCPPRPGFGMVSPEQRLMMFADIKAQADSAAVDPQLLRQMQRDKLRAMTEDQRKAYFADLTKRWNAMPAEQQKDIKAAAETWRAAHPRPEGRPDCPHPAH